MAPEASDPEPLGWAAIDSALEALYPDQQPKHWAPVLPAMLGGDDPLQGISAYASEQPLRHWHFVTYGFSDLYEKESADPAISGFGFELTFRLVCAASDEPPSWCPNFLQNLGRYVFASGNAFEPGHHMNLNGPIALDTDTAIQAIAFLDDPQLHPVDTPNGRLRFLQIVGLTLDEVQAIRRWDASKFLQLLSTQIPLATTDLGRPSVLLTPEVRTAVEHGIASDGSSTGLLYVAALSWQQKARLLRRTETTIVLGANGVRNFGPALRGRIPFGRPLSVLGPESLVTFEPGPELAVSTETNEDLTTLRVTLSAENATALADLVQPVAGTYAHPALPNLRIVVERSLIKSPDGEVRETIG